MCRVFLRFYIILILPLIGRSADTEKIIKYLKTPKEKIKLICPKKHVIYIPTILAGVVGGNNCTDEKHDCVTEAKGLQKQIDRCHWKKSCIVLLKNNDILKCGCTGKRKLQHIDYVIIHQPYCIPKRLISDICLKTDIKDFSKGVIRSHNRYPRRLKIANKQSYRYISEIPIKRSDSLFIAVLTDASCASKTPSVRLYAKMHNGTDTKMNIDNLTSKEATIILLGNETLSVRIEAKFVSRKKCQGFLIPFAAYNTKSLQKLMAWPKPSWAVIKDLGWIFQVRAVIEMCTVSTAGKASLVCGPGQLIYAPEIYMSGYTRFKAKCLLEDYPCGGQTLGLAVQSNNCYFRNTCDITWSGNDRIVLSTRTSCIGYIGSSLGLAGHRCVHKQNIYDVCTNDTSLITDDWGILRSHASYPWYFHTDLTQCTRVIKIGKKATLLVIVQDINIDPDGRDTFSIMHQHHKVTREILNTKKAREGSQITVKGGRLVIRFEKFQKSKSGRGFVLVFKLHPLPASGNMSLDTSDYVKPTGELLLNDGRQIATHRPSNRRLCAGSKADRKRGRACKARVWTDYFSRLER